MRNAGKFIVSLILLGILIPWTVETPDTRAWGFFAHRKINRMAVFTLPPEMIGFYKQNIDYITEHAVDPDKRRYASEDEAPRHYIDIDHYAPKGANPFDSVPKRWKDAVTKYSEDTLKAYGIVPWHISVMVGRLREAFEKNNVDAILRLSADLGHYVGDSHVPLHATVNYNGQLTGQKGIHAFWESRLPELFHEDYDYMVGRADYIKDPLDYAWTAVHGSFWAKDSVLDFDRELTKTFPEDQKYAFETRGRVLMKQYSVEYATAYNKMLGGMVERRMRRAIKAVGSLWYTAWVDAGQPDLDALMLTAHKEKRSDEEELDKLFNSGKIKGRLHDE